MDYNTNKMILFQNGATTEVSGGTTDFPPMDIFVNNAGTKFVVGAIGSGGTNKITAVTSQGVPSTFATVSGVNLINGIGGDNAGNLFVSAYYHKIYKVDSTGTVTRYAGTGTEGITVDETDALTANIYNPYGITVDPDTGDVFFASPGGFMIQMIRFVDQKLVTLVGGGMYCLLNKHFLSIIHVYCR